MSLIRKFAALLLAVTLAACSGSPSWLPLNPIASTATSNSATAAPTLVPTAAQLALTATATSQPTAIFEPTATPEPQPAQYLVLVSMDAFRPEYFSLADMPNLNALFRAGIFYSGSWAGGLENNTPTGHTEMSTGSYPGHSGVTGYFWGDLSKDEWFNPTTLDAVNNGEMAKVVEESGVPTLAGSIKAKYPNDIVAVISSSKNYAAQGLGMGPADFILYGTMTDDQNAKLAAVNGRSPDADFMNDPGLSINVDYRGGENVFAIRAGIAAMNRYHPRALMLQLAESDELGHKTGGLTDPKSMSELMVTTDQALGELFQAYKRAGIFDQTLWVFTSDHGMTPKGTNIIVPSEMYQTLGLTFEDKEQTFLPLISLIDHSRAESIADAIASTHTDGITGVYYKNQNSNAYELAPSMEGQVPETLNQAYLYLLSTYENQYSPDIVVTTSGNAAFDKRHESPGGSHNMINWDDQHNFLAFSGPGVTAGVTSTSPSRLIDILPTIARLMDLPTEKWDGIVLADALANPQAEDVAAQMKINEQLTPLRDALAATGEK